MWVILIIACIGIPFICIRFLTARFQKFFDLGGFTEEPKLCSAIVMGKTDFSKQVRSLLEKDRVCVTFVSDPYMLEHKQSYNYLFALSGNDVDNILMCRIAERVYNIKTMISICNDRINEKIFENGNIPYIPGEGATAQMLVQAVLKKKDVLLCQEH